jgi:hypothetical protein
VTQVTRHVVVIGALTRFISTREQQVWHLSEPTILANLVCSGLMSGPAGREAQMALV